MYYQLQYSLLYALCSHCIAPLPFTVLLLFMDSQITRVMKSSCPIGAIALALAVLLGVFARLFIKFNCVIVLIQVKVFTYARKE